MSYIETAHALVIGIANYDHVSALPQTVLKDVNDTFQTLVDAHICAYPPGNVQLLLDKQATQLAIRDGLKALAEQATNDSTVLIYLSSHGGRIEEGPHAGEYILPVDTHYTSNESIAQTAISGREFTEALRAIPARKLVVIFDCCHSGGIGQPKDASAVASVKSGLSESYYDTLKAGRGRVIFASSRSDELSWIKPAAQNSLFTQYVLAGLKGGAVGAGGVIRIFDLFDYVQPRVTQDQSNQHPIFKAEVEDNFPIALYLGGKAPALVPTAPPSDGFAYDVFLSYRQKEPDKTWVRKTLLPKLEAEDLRVCIDYRDFRLGAPIINEMERAVIESRYTLGVLTPSYLESNFTELENILAEHLGLEKSQRRWIAALREDCKPRLRIRARMWLDMTDDEEFDANLARLVYELRLPPK